MSMHKSLLAVVGALALTAAHAADNTPEELMQTKQRFERQITKTLSLKYLLYLPKGYEAKGDTHWPLMLFLHGAGERGTNLSKVAVHGPPKLVKQGKAFPFIIVSPQCPDGESWSNEVLLSLLDDVIARHAVDKIGRAHV